MIGVVTPRPPGSAQSLNRQSEPRNGRLQDPPLAREEFVVFLDCGAEFEGLQSELRKGGYRVLAPSGCDGLLEVLDHLPVGLILLGHQEAAGVDPVDDIKELARRAPAAVVLRLLSDWEWSAAKRTLQAGVDDVVPPPHDAAAVLFRAGVARTRRTLPAQGVPPAIRELGDMVVDIQRRELQVGGSAVPLTGREFELIHTLMEADGSAVSREKLLEDIWGPEQDSAAVLDATVHRLRRKLERDPSAPRRLTTVRGRGYRLEPGAFRPLVPQKG